MVRAGETGLTDASATTFASMTKPNSFGAGKTKFTDESLLAMAANVDLAGIQDNRVNAAPAPEHLSRRWKPCRCRTVRARAIPVALVASVQDGRTDAKMRHWNGGRPDFADPATFPPVRNRSDVPVRCSPDCPGPASASATPA